MVGLERVATVVDVIHVDPESGSYALVIGDCAAILHDCHLGDSIAVNGVCLTVTKFDEKEHQGFFKVDLAPETLFRSNLGALRVGDKVNCERAMSPTTRFGGHIVQGHVDTMATLQSIVPNESALTLTLRLVYEKPEADRATLPLPSTLAPYLIPKGFVTLDGTSLTLIDVSPPNGGPLSGTQDTSVPTSETVEFTVMLIPHTQDHIALPSKAVGSRVNVEFDMVGKYVYRSLLGEFQRMDESASSGGHLSSTMLERVVERAVDTIQQRRSA
ncbi:Riboflavin synthase alpha chain [Malassezia pachydermatis]